MRRKAVIIMILCFTSLLIFTSSQGEENKIREITAPEVKDMLKDSNVMIINNLSNLEFELQHIPGSINIPFDKMKGTDKLPEDKTTPIIFYCMASM